jgi:hypothetical protein
MQKLEENKAPAYKTFESYMMLEKLKDLDRQNHNPVHSAFIDGARAALHWMRENDDETALEFRLAVIKEESQERK